MSADNWRECPHCAKKRLEVAAKQVKLEGTIDEVQEQLRVLKEAELDRPSGEINSLREDYEWWLDGETVCGSYGCECLVCGFKRSVDVRDPAGES